MVKREPFPKQMKQPALQAGHGARRLGLGVLLGTVAVIAVAGHAGAGEQPGGRAPALVPGRQIVQEAPAALEWKKLWDKARELVRQGSYQQAAAIYRQLLDRKANLEAARRELARLYLHIQAWDRAAAEFELLLENDPQRVEDLVGLARVLEHQQHHGRAAELYRKVREREPDNETALTGLLRQLLALGRKREALSLLEELYQLRPGDRGVRLQLARLAYELNELEKARPHLVALAESADADSAILLMAARLHERLGLGNLAVGYWQRLVELDPDNLEAHAKLARHYEESGRLGQAIAHLKAILAQRPGDVDLLRRIGDALVKTGKSGEALAYLERYAAARPEDVETLETILGIYAATDQQDKALRSLEKFLTVEERPGPGRLRQAARLYDAAGRPEDAVPLYLRLLDEVGLEPDLVAALAADYRVLGLQGRYGFLRQQLPRLADMKAEVGAVVRLEVAEALAAGGAYRAAAAELRKLTDAAEADVAVPALLALAAVQDAVGLEYEAEQARRQALVISPRSGKAFEALCLHALKRGDPAAAAAWLEGWRTSVEAGGNGNGEAPGEAAEEWRIELAHVRLLMAQEAYSDAAKLARRYWSRYPGRTSAAVGPERASIRARFGLELAAALLADGRPRAAEQQASTLLAADGGALALEAHVFLQKLYHDGGRIDREREIFLDALAVADRKPVKLLRLAELYRQYGLTEAMLKTAALACGQLPGSLRAGLLQAEAKWLEEGEGSGAVAQLEELAAEYPEERYAAVRRTQFLFAAGRYGPALEAAEALLSSGTVRPDLLLIKARILWARNRWSEAFEVYREFLTPSVAPVVRGELDAAGLAIPAAPGGRSFWVAIGIAKGTTDDVAILMDPSQAANNLWPKQRQRNAIAAHHYALYCWQRRFEAELAARQAVQRREYFRAARLFRDLVAAHPDQPSLLFDLAGIYNRLDRLGEEAAVYRQLAAMKADLPGLNEARIRNHLTRRPRTSLGYGYQKEEGRDGYKAMERDWQELKVWISPRLQHEFALNLSRIRYRDPDSDRGVAADRLAATYEADLARWLTVELGGGLENLDDGRATTGLFHGAVRGKAGDLFETYIAGERDIVTDTSASVLRNIVSQRISAGANVDVLPQLKVGGDYGYTDFSDGNSLKDYDLWATYVIFFKPASLQLHYLYGYKDSDAGASPGPPLADGFAAADHPYWSPVNYWVNRFGATFRHQLSEEGLDREMRRYYTAEYFVDYDSKGYQIQTVKGAFSLEWTPHLILEASASLVSSQPYRSKEIALSAVYRW